jgi:L-amino acid N-acyltransferase
MTIRRATEADLPGITEIYNDAILRTVATFDTEPKSIADRAKWLAAHSEKFPVFVATEEGNPGRIEGWASISRWSERAAYDDTGEISVYVREDCRGRGIGTALTDAILKAAKTVGIHTVISRVTSGNEASTKLHAAMGFCLVGVLREVGHKFGRILDVDILQIVFR